MSDTPSGTSTSEFKMATLVAVFGAILSGLTVTFGSLHSDFPDYGWIGLIAGALTTIAPVLSYIKSRSTVKAAEATADAIVQAGLRATVTLPVAQGGAAKNPLP